jgi:hypothetical protein
MIMLFQSGETVRFMPRSRDIAPMDAVIASKPMGIRDVPALGVFYFVIAPTYRGVVSADRLSHASVSIAKMLQTFARRAEFKES